MIRPDIAALRVPTLSLLVATVLAAIGIFWSHDRNEDAGAALQQQRTTLNAARARARQAEQDARMIAEHLDGYRALATRGFVGDERRLAWIEAAQLANRDARLYGLSYTLSPRVAAPPDLAGDLPLRQTRMVLKMPLLVEADLPRFLDALHARAPGLFRVTHCRMERIADTPPRPINVPELAAECELLWFTLSADPGAPA